jgi:opacity protein-like surface antigen
MKRIVLLTLLIAGLVSLTFAQNKVNPNKPGVEFNPKSGYITINELVGGFGLGITNTPYSKGFFGFTTIHGYQVNKEFVVAGGTGLHFYNEGMLMPLFLDLRYRFYISQFTIYAFGDGGLLLDFSGKKDTRLFINPGLGVRYAIKRNLAVNLGTGLFIQFGNSRDSYLNLKTGVTYKF